MKKAERNNVLWVFIDYINESHESRQDLLRFAYVSDMRCNHVESRRERIQKKGANSEFSDAFFYKYNVRFSIENLYLCSSPCTEVNHSKNRISGNARSQSLSSFVFVFLFSILYFFSFFLYFYFKFNFIQLISTPPWIMVEIARSLVERMQLPLHIAQWRTDWRI